MLFNWKKEYTTGITEIDVQHMELVRLGSKIEKLLLQQKDDMFDELVDLINSLKAYTVYHFAAEEHIMESHDYPHVETHKEDHQAFIDQLNEIDLDELDVQQTQQAMDLIKFISKWIFSHILGSDAEYKLYFESKGLVSTINQTK